MNGLERALYVALSGYAPGGEPKTPDAVLRWLTAAAGGPGAAARAIGVHPATYRRWRAGTTRPNRHSVELIRMAIRRTRLDAKREERLRDRGPGQLWMRVHDRDSGRDRVLTAPQLRISPAAIDNQILAFLLDEPLAPAFIADVGDGFYQEWLDPSNLSDYGFTIVALKW